MKMQKPEMEVVRFLAEDILTVSGPSHYFDTLTGLLVTPDACAGLLHAHVLTYDGTRFKGDKYLESGVQGDDLSVKENNFMVSGVAQTIKDRLAAGDTEIWISMPDAKFVFCPDSGK